MAKKNKLPDIKGAQVLVPTNVSEIIGTRDEIGRASCRERV